jgi:hypothetical protein
MIVAGSYEHTNEPSGSKTGEKFDSLSKDNVSRSWLISPLNLLINHEEQTKNSNRIST